MKRSDLHYSGIYIFTHKLNGKVYIGQSINIFKRLAGHKRMREKTKFCNALRKYGFDAFRFEVIERVDDHSKLDEREQHWMDFYQCYKEDKGYNISPTAGSQRGFKMSPSRIEQMREVGKKLYQNGFRPFAGRVLSEEARQRISQKNRKYKLTPEQRAKFLENNKPPTPDQLSLATRRSVEMIRCKIHQIDLQTGETIKIWESLMDIKENSKFNHYGVDKACRGYYFSRERQEYISVDSYNGFKWQRETEGKIIRPTKPKVVLPPQQKVKKIAQINIQTGCILKVWNFAGDIESELGLKKASIQNVCRGKWWCSKHKKYKEKLSFGGYKWQYIVE